MLDNERYLYDDKQFKFLQEQSNRILSKAQILLVLLSHELLSTLHVTHQYTILYIHFIKLNLNLKEFQECNKYFKSYQESKIEFLDESYFKLILHLILNIKSDFQENS